MIEQDTVRLLRECDAGIKMGVEAIDQVESYVHSGGLGQCLKESKAAHQELGREMEALLGRYHDRGKEPGAMAKGMAWVKTNAKLTVNESDATIADLITDGCNMGVKGLCRYLNRYKAADEASKGLTKRVVRLEEELAAEMRPYL